MDQILLGLGAAGAALLIIAIAVALWEHRRHLAEMRQQLAWSENTRDLLQAHAQQVDARLATLTAVVAQQALAVAPAAGSSATAPAGDRSAAAPAGGTSAAADAAHTAPAADPAQAPAQPRLTAHAGSAAVAMAAAQSAVTQQWIDTEPMVLTSQVITQVPDFDPTMPVELSAH